MPAEYFDYSKRGAATRNTKVPPAAPLLSIGGNRLARRACYRCKTILLLGNIFSDIKCDSNYDNDTLCYILIVRVNSEELETCLQKLEYKNSDYDTGYTSDTAVNGYAADCTGRDGLQLVAHPC